MKKTLPEKPFSLVPPKLGNNLKLECVDGTLAAFQQLVERSIDRDVYQTYYFEFLPGQHVEPFSPFIQCIRYFQRKLAVSTTELLTKAGVSPVWASYARQVIDGSPADLPDLIARNDAEYIRLEIIRALGRIFEVITEEQPVVMAVAGVHHGGRSLLEVLQLMLNSRIRGHWQVWLHLSQSAQFQHFDDQQYWLEFWSMAEQKYSFRKAHETQKVIQAKWHHTEQQSDPDEARQLMRMYTSTFHYREAELIAENQLRQLQRSQAHYSPEIFINMALAIAKAAYYANNLSLAVRLYEQVRSVSELGEYPELVLELHLYLALSALSHQQMSLMSEFIQQAKQINDIDNVANAKLLVSYLEFQHACYSTLEFNYADYRRLLDDLENAELHNLRTSCLRNVFRFQNVWSEVPKKDFERIAIELTQSYKAEVNLLGLSKIYYAKANMYLFRSQHRKAVRCLQLCYRIRKRLYVDHRQSIILNALGFYLAEIEQFDQAENKHLKALFQLFRNPDVKEILMTLYNLAWLYFNRGHFNICQHISGSMIRIFHHWQRSEVPFHTLMDCMVLRSICQYHTGEQDQAFRGLDQIAGQKDQLTPDGRLLWVQLTAWRHAEAGSTRQAAEFLGEYLNTDATASCSSVFSRLNALQDLAVLTELSGDPDKSKQVIDEMAQICQQRQLKQRLKTIRQEANYGNLDAGFYGARRDVRTDLEIIEQMVRLFLGKQRQMALLTENWLQNSVHQLGLDSDNLFDLAQGVLDLISHHVRGRASVFISFSEQKEGQVLASIGSSSDCASLSSMALPNEPTSSFSDQLLTIPIMNDGNLAVLIRVALSESQLISTENLVQYDNLGQLLGLLIERLEKATELLLLSRTCPLTKLVNRQALYEAMSVEIRRQQRYTGVKPFSLLYLDLDNFKLYNDNYGHGFGDRILKHLARELESLVRETDMVSRMGGDEFVIMMPETTIHQAMKLAERVLKLFRTGGSMMQVSAQGKNLPASSLLSCSIGITDSVFSDEDSQVADPVETLLNRADKAMYVSKAEGKGRVTKS